MASVGEETLALHLRAHGIPFEREVRFHPPRRFRFDFAICPGELRLAAEVDGGTWAQGRHARGAGIASDCEKVNLAAEDGWTVLRFTTDMVEAGTAIDTILRVVEVLRDQHASEPTA